jgi:hypothetical protein
MKRPRSVLKTVVAPIVVTVAIIPTLSIAVWETFHGRGAANYSNFYGLAIPYTSVLILVLALVLAMAVAYIARVVYFWCDSHDRGVNLRKTGSRGASVDSSDVK